MIKQTIQITPLDTVFFKDGKPFSMGDDTWASGVFPPYPSVIYGAIRSAFLAQNAETTVDNIIERTENLKILNLYLLLGGEPAMPIGADMIKYKVKYSDKRFKEFKNPKYLELTSFANSSNQLDQALIAGESYKADKYEGGGYLQDTAFIDYLAYDDDEIIASALSNYMTSEPKIGIGRNDRLKSTEDGLLYRVGMQRLAHANKNNHIRIAVEFEGLPEKLEDKGIIKIGAEGKTADYFTISTSINLELSIDDITSDTIRVYLATPAIYTDGGWEPSWMKARQFEGIGFELLTCALGKPIPIGGYDLKESKPKTMYKAVPAGSVYYLKTESVEAARELAQKLMDAQSNFSKTITDGALWIEQGFGKFYIGNYQN